jgi:hypothetical protein
MRTTFIYIYIYEYMGVGGDSLIVWRGLQFRPLGSSSSTDTRSRKGGQGGGGRRRKRRESHMQIWLQIIFTALRMSPGLYKKNS